MKTLSHLILILFALVLDPSWASADWQAKMLTRYGKDEKNEVSGKIFVKGQKVRLDVSAPTEMSIIYDQTTKASSALVHTAKIRLDGGFEQYQERIPLCTVGEPEACFKKLGWKKVRSENFNGQACDVYQGKGHGKNKSDEYEITVWKPTQQKEVPALKTLVIMKDGDQVETLFSDVNTQAIEPSTFNIPKNYIRAGGLDQVFKGLKGFNGS